MKRYLTGSNGVNEAIKHGQGVLFIAKKCDRSYALIKSAQQYGVSVKHVSSGDLDRLVSGNEHRGFVLEIEKSVGLKRIRHLDELWDFVGESSLVILLDGITDPQNLGAVLRTADQFCADAIITPRRRSASGDADSISRTSSGAVEWVNLIEVSNLVRSMEELQSRGYWVRGADMLGQPAHHVDFKGKNALVMGREGQGLHRLVKEKCDELVAIPGGGHLDSLNVAVATGILMYEIRRQQEFPYPKRQQG